MSIQPPLVYDPATADPVNGGQLLLGSQRSLLAIYTDLNALSAAQKNAIWTAFTAGSPPKWSQDGADGNTWGTNAPALAAASISAIDAGLAGAAITNARLKMVAVYLLDNPNWLKNPAFDPSISVLPYTPIS